ncbi:hypothetical protein C8Q74DRAFT_1199823 [Fomes fomentarius]|nr:hypothetical protein C8Q74DRAFT_1199823 [Fomes fomentarius]
MSEFYKATFRWPHPDASDVIVTGSFDGWSCSHHLTKTPTGSFEGTVDISWSDKVSYKYIVDGRWTTTDDQPTELDPVGNLNNVFRAPARPEPEPTRAPASAPKTVIEPETTNATGRNTVGAVNGILGTAKQAAVDSVEVLAPGTAETPVPTPAVQVRTPFSSFECQCQTPATAPDPEPTPISAPAESVIETASTPSEPTPVAPFVPVPVLPLSTESTTDAATTPVADVSETKPLDIAIVEDSATAATAVVPAPDAPASEEKPSTHVPATTNGTTEESPATNGVGPAEENATATSTNGTPVSPPKPATNGSTTKAATVNGKGTTPTKEKKMRFPSLSSRHSRTRSSLESGASASASELGVKVKETNGKETVSSRFTSTQRQKRRTSLFGKLKDVFSHPKNDASA